MRASQARTKKRAPAKTRTLPNVPWRAVASVIGVVVLSAGVYQGTLWVMDRPFEAIVASGPFHRVPAVQIEAAVAPFIAAGFLSADLDDVRDALENLPWVSAASVGRRWPHTLEISIDEEVAAACWGESGLVNRDGDLFVAEARHVPAELPRLAGPPGSEAEVTGRFFAIQEGLQQRGLSAVGLTLDSRGAWRVRLSDGLEIRLGSREVDERVARFLDAVDLMPQGLSVDMSYIDMRYTNGFAVGWRRNERAALEPASDGDRGV